MVETLSKPLVVAKQRCCRKTNMKHCYEHGKFTSYKIIMCNFIMLSRGICVRPNMVSKQNSQAQLFNSLNYYNVVYSKNTNNFVLVLDNRQLYCFFNIEYHLEFEIST